MKTSEEVRAVKELLFRRGWIQYAWQTDRGVCLSKAVNLTFGQA